MKTTATRGSAFRGRAGDASSQLRISDAERAEVADRLSEHYGDGRLNETEFNERVDQAMRARTRADLSGLFADLPETGEPMPAASRPARRPGQHHLLLLVLVVVVAAVAGRALMAMFIPWWLLIGLLAFLFLRYGPSHRPHG